LIGTNLWGAYKDELSKIIDTSQESSSFKTQLLEKLQLIRVGLYPNGKYGATYFAAFDYSIEIDGEPCNQLLVVKTNEKGKLDNIAWES
jgi:hypothetical protein